MASSIAKRNAPLNAPFKNVRTVLMTTALLANTTNKSMSSRLSIPRVTSALGNGGVGSGFRLPTRSQRHSPIRNPLGFVVTRCRVQLRPKSAVFGTVLFPLPPTGARHRSLRTKERNGWPWSWDQPQWWARHGKSGGNAEDLAAWDKGNSSSTSDSM